MTAYDIEQSPKLLRQYIQNQRCWICGKNGWRALSIHLIKKHGLPAAEVREMAYMNKRERLISEDLSGYLRAKSLLPGGIKERRYNGGQQKRHILSRRAKDLFRDQAHKIRPLTLETHEPFKKPHPCPVCGTSISTARPVHCSAECTHIARARATSKSMTPERIEAFKAVIHRRTPQEQGAIAKKFWQEFRARPKDEQKDFLLRRAAPLKLPRVEQHCVICGNAFYLTPYQAKRQQRTKTCGNPSCRVALKRRNQLGRRHTEVSKKKMSEHAIRRHQIEGGRFGKAIAQKDYAEV